jgi:hypothetical protein
MNYASHWLRQGLWIADLQNPPGPEGSNGSLLCICRSHPGISFTIYDLRFTIEGTRCPQAGHKSQIIHLIFLWPIK